MTFSLATYNIQIPLAKKEDYPWSGRRTNLLTSLPQLADVVCLQEVSYIDEGQGYEVSETLHYAGYQGYEPAKITPLAYSDVFHQRVPIFWKENKFELCSEPETMMLTTGTAEQQLDHPYLENRYCSLVLLEEKASRKRVLIGNLHLQHVPIGLENIPAYRDTQLLGLAVLQQYLTDMNQSNNPAVISGDYNMADPEFAGFHSTAHIADRIHESKMSSYHGYSSLPLKDGNNIDHIMVNTRVAVHEHELLTLVNGSDHFPLKAQLQLN